MRQNRRREALLAHILLFLGIRIIVNKLAIVTKINNILNTIILQN